MSKVSICGNGWTNLVFEGRNKEYGAYQLRKEDSVNTITAFFFGLLFIISIFGIGFLLSSFNSKAVVAEPEHFFPPIHITKFENHIREEPKKEILPLKKKEIEKVVTKKDLIHPIITKSTEPVDEINTNNDNNYVIEHDTLEEINKEFNSYILQKHALLKLIRDFNEKMNLSVNELKMPCIEKFLSSNFATSSVQGDKICKYCEKYIPKSMSSHHRYCSSKKEPDTITIDIVLPTTQTPDDAKTKRKKA